MALDRLSLKTIIYNQKDLNVEIILKDICSESKFDSHLISTWTAAMNNGHFRYKWEDLRSKILPGKFKFLIQLNVKRAEERRKPQHINHVSMPFEPSLFNFTKVPDHEILLEICRIEDHFDDGKETSTGEVSKCPKKYHCPIMINVSPLEFCHSLVVLEPEKGLPQVLTPLGIRIAIECILLSSNVNLRAVYNSLGAYASVNHYHFHLYYLAHRLYLETANAICIEDECYTLVDYPAECFLFQVTSLKTMENSIKAIEKLIAFLLQIEIPHNLLVTRGSRLDEKDEKARFDAVRVFVWARSASFGIKDTSDFNVGVCELTGHFPIKSEMAFEELGEEELQQALYETCHDTFVRHVDAIKALYKK